MRHRHSGAAAVAALGIALAAPVACVPPATAADTASATVTATPPARAAVKPAQPARQRHCGVEARLQIASERRQTLTAACLRQKRS